MGEFTMQAIGPATARPNELVNGWHVSIIANDPPSLAAACREFLRLIDRARRAEAALLKRARAGRALPPPARQKRMRLRIRRVQRVIEMGCEIHGIDCTALREPGFKNHPQLTAKVRTVVKELLRATGGASGEAKAFRAWVSSRMKLSWPRPWIQAWRPTAVALGKPGGAKGGGKARAAALTPAKRKAIAKKAAAKRWG